MSLINKIFSPAIKREQPSSQIQRLKKQIRSLRMTVIFIFILAIILILIATKPLSNKVSNQENAMGDNRVNFQRISLP